MFPKIVTRKTDASISQLLASTSLTELQSRIVANRCYADTISEPILRQIVNDSLRNIATPNLLADSDVAVQRIAYAIKHQEVIGLLTDYDVDGITSHSILFFALRDYFGVAESCIQHLIGHRIDDGYGVSQGLIDRILKQEQLPHVIITADCGSSDEQQIAQLKERGIDVIVTDHHAIPQEGIPLSAIATVNPTRDDCQYPDNTIAGCMVAWLLMSLLRSELINQQQITKDSPKLSGLLDFVSLGTVADAVSLASPINRAVVNSGLKILNQLQRPCWQAMKDILDRDFQPFTTEDLGFQIGPRINARSRMSDPYKALHFLCAENATESLQHLKELDEDNQLRKATEKSMLSKAFELAQDQLTQQSNSMVMFDKAFHPGVQGIVASRLMEKYGRPVIVLSPTNDESQLTGSARTIPKVHIRQALEYVANQAPESILGFGGHKGAAGLKLKVSALEQFKLLFEQAVALQMDSDAELRPEILTDGKLLEQQLTFETIAELRQLEPYGREFEAPVFEGDFLVQSIRSVGEDGTHLMLQLGTDSQSFRAIWFRALEKKDEPFPFVVGQIIHAVYQLKENFYKGKFSLQLQIIFASL